MCAWRNEVLDGGNSTRSSRRRRNDGREEIASRARQYLEAHFAERVRIATLAAVCGVSSFHLIRLFHREIGLPPHAYLKQVRLGKAVELLRQGMPVSMVAYACGFADQSHLTRSFKRTWGVPPRRFIHASRIDASPT
jgi:AraC-like DNA-binding protein